MNMIHYNPATNKERLYKMPEQDIKCQEYFNIVTSRIQNAYLTSSPTVIGQIMPSLFGQYEMTFISRLSQTKNADLKGALITLVLPFL